MLFIPEGDGYVHNHMNFGNFLWGAAGYSLGVDGPILQLGAHYNSVANPKKNQYESQLDSKDDQLSIIRGAQFSLDHDYEDIEEKPIVPIKERSR